MTGDRRRNQRTIRGSLLLAWAAMILFAVPLAADDIDNAGTEFIMAFLPNHDGDSFVELHLTADDSTEVYVEYPMNAPTLYDTVSVTPGTITIVSLPTEAANNWDIGTWTAGNTVRAHASKEFVCYMINRQPYSSDAALGLPVDAMNKDYIVITHRGASHGFDAGEFAVVSREDNTEVTITPTNDLVGGFVAGAPFTVTLNRGEAFLGMSSAVIGDPADLTGTIISATQPIWMVNGNRCTNVPVTTVACDHVFEVAQPVQSWGKKIFSTDLPQRTNGSFFRVVAAADSTELRLDGNVIDTLDRGEMYEASYLKGNHVWSGSNGIFVVEYMSSQAALGATAGDPAMGNLAPSEQYLHDYTFATPGFGQFQTHYLTIVAHVADITNGTILLDGSPIPSAVFSQVPATDYWATSMQISEGTHTTSSIDFPHGILVTGYNSYDSYLYPGGALFVPIQSVDDTIPPVCNVTSEDDCGAAVTATDDHVDAAGIFVIRLDNGSGNLGLDYAPFDQGATSVSYTVYVVDSTLPASGSVTVIDGEGNTCTESFEFDCSGGGGITPTYAWINVYCSEPMLNDVLLAPGDTIMAYDPDGVLCGMEVVGETGGYGFMPIYRDDEYTMEDEGAEPGDLISFAVNSQLVTTDPLIYWTENGDRFELCGFLTEKCRTLELDEGWNLVSWNVQYSNPIDSFVASFKECVEVMLGFNGDGLTYVPGLERYATLNDVDFFGGYWIKLSCPVSIELCGEPIDPTMSINVYGGWNLVSYWPDEPLPFDDAFTSIMSSLEVALGYDNGALVYVADSNGFNTLDSLRPGFGYWAKVDLDGLLAYPGFGQPGVGLKYDRRPVAAAARPYTATRRWVSVYGDNLTIDGRPLENGADVELLSSDGTVIGSGRYSGDVLKFTAAYGRDASIAGTDDYPSDGDLITVAVDGTPLYPQVEWAGHGALVELSALSTTADGVVVPGSYSLDQNYPNPFNPSTTISFSLPNAGHVELVVYNLLGRKIRTLISDDLGAGEHSVEWDGRIDDGAEASTGIYFYRLQTGDFSQTRKMMLLK